MSQPAFIDKILATHNMGECRTSPTPMEPNANNCLVPAPDTYTADPGDVTAFKSGLGEINYLATQTRPDIAFAAGKLAAFSSNPNYQHWQAYKKVLRYLAGTRTRGVAFGTTKTATLQPFGYSDADWAGEISTARSTAGMIMMLNGGPINWRSAKQKTVARSTCEAEYMAASDAAQDMIWIRYILPELGQQLDGPSTIQCDNKGAIDLAKNPVDHKRSRHINVSYHFVRELIANQTLRYEYVPTKDMKADGLTKALTTTKFSDFIEMMGLVDKDLD